MKSTPILEVHELELSSLCNLACKYCPHPVLQRQKGNIGWDAFERALLHIEHYVKAGTQTELSLTGIGEAILHPRFEEALFRCREAIGPGRLLVVSTNGVALEEHHAKALARVRARVYVSLHRPEVATPAGHLLARMGVEVHANHAFVDSGMNWAGQIEWPVSAPTKQCDYLGLGWAVIRQNGNVDACCQDAHDLHPLGTVWDEPGSWRTKPTPLCANCHLCVPKHFDQEEADVRAA